MPLPAGPSRLRRKYYSTMSCATGAALTAQKPLLFYMNATTEICG